MKTKAAISQDGPPKNFLNRFGEHVTGFLNGLDRVRFRATLRPLFCPNAPEVYLNNFKVLIKNFKGFAQGLSDGFKSWPTTDSSRTAQHLFAKSGARFRSGGLKILAKLRDVPCQQCKEPKVSFSLFTDRILVMRTLG